MRNARLGRVRTRISPLAAGAPIGGAVVLALSARAHDRAAAGAGAAGLLVHRRAGLVAPARHRPAHPRSRLAHHAQRLAVGYVLDRPPGVDPGGEAGFRLPDVADARHVALVEQGVPQAAALVVLAQAPQEEPLVEVLGHHVGPE